MKGSQSYKQKHGLKGKKFKRAIGIHPVDALLEIFPEVSPVFIKAMRKFCNQNIDKSKLKDVL